MGVISSLNGGELTPLLRCRPEIEKYASGSMKLENFTVLPQGGIENRPGTLFLFAAKYPDKNIRLVPFEYSLDQSYILEFGDLYMRIYRDRAPVYNGDAPCEIALPYSHESLRKLRWVQSGDVLFIVHPDYPPAKISRYGERDWRYAVLPFKSGPFMDENTTDTTVTPSGVTGSITLTASADIFTADMVGEFFEIIHPNSDSNLSKNFTGNAVSGGIEIFGKWRLVTSGGWRGTLKLRRSFDRGITWNDYRSWVSTQDRNIDTTGTEAKEGVLYRLEMLNWQTSETVAYNCLANLSSEAYWINGIVTITGVSGPRAAAADVIRELGGTAATDDWAFGAWNPRCGYPATVAFFEDRMIFGATKRQPQTFWFSKNSDYNNLTLGNEADDAMTFTLRSQRLNAINWVLPLKKLIIGTSSGEGVLGPVDEKEPLHPGNRKYSPETNCGSTTLPAMLVNDAILFLQRGGEHLRELSYNFDEDGYLAPDISVYAEHILAGGAVEVAYRQLPFPVIFFVRNDGVLVALTYDRVQNVTAFGRLVTEGEFMSVAVIGNNQRDDVYLACKRNGAVTVEVLLQKSDEVYLDCAKRYQFETPQTDLTGLDHWNGRALRAVADAIIYDDLVVSNGAVTLPNPDKSVVIGMPYVSRWESMPLEMMAQAGATNGMVKKVARVRLMYHDSLGGRAGLASGGELTDIDQRMAYHLLDAALPAESGEYVVVCPGCYTTDERVVVEQHLPLPFTLLGVVHDLEVVG